jgi:hypothetical protein
MPLCREVDPLLGALEDGRRVRCHLYPVSTPAGAAAAAPAS